MAITKPDWDAIGRGQAVLDDEPTKPPKDTSVSFGSYTGWGIPELLPDSLLPVEPFDMALLPEALRPWAEDIVARIQCPPDFVGATVMAALGALIGRRVGIRPKRYDDWTEYPNIWLGVISPPGTLKTPGMAAGLGQLERLQAAALGRHEGERARHDQESKVFKMRQAAKEKHAAAELAKNPAAMITLEAIEEPRPPALRRYLVNDATVEALLDICIENPQGFAVFRDELVGLLKSLEKDGQEGARGFYLSGWNGNSSYTADRIGRGKNIRAEAVNLSLIGSTQPGAISQYLHAAIRGGASDDGLIQRFGLLIWPDVCGKWVNIDRWPDSHAKRAAFDVFERLDRADPVRDWGAEIVTGFDGVAVAGEPPFLRFGEEAAETFLLWRVGLENELRTGSLHPALESHLAKYRKLVPGLALICHLADDGKGPVSNAAAVRALAWAHYLRSHAERAYGSVTLADVASAKALLRRLQRGDLLNGFTARDVYRKQWSMLVTPDEVAKALDVLVDHGWIRGTTVHSEGRPKTTYDVNPRAPQ